MGNSKRSLGGHLVLTAWESWSAEPHWRNAVIVMIVGTVAFSIAKPKQGNSSQQNNQAGQLQQGQGGIQNQPNSGGATLISVVPKAPPKLKPKQSSDDVIINEEETDKDSNFGKIRGE